MLCAFSGREGQGRCGHHPVLSLVTRQRTLPSEWATRARISFTTHQERRIHLHFQPLKCKVKVDLQHKTVWLLRELDSRKIEAGITGSVGSETEPVISENGSQWRRMMEDVHAANTYRHI